MSSHTQPLAISKQSFPTHPPILSPGKITYDNFKTFEYMCNRFFSHKAIIPTDQVSRIIFNFEDESVQDWLEGDFVKYSALSFADFILEFKKKWFPRHWLDDIIDRVINSQGLRPFWTWVIDVKKCNTLLVGKSHHVKPENLKDHLVARFHISLRTAYRDSDNYKALEEMLDFDNWVEQVRIIDEKIRSRREANSKNYINKLVAESIASHLPLSTNITNTTATASNSTPTLSSSRPPSTFNTTQRLPNTTPRLFIPKLTDDEKTLLASHGGCYKCREFYTGHYADTCTVPHPTPEAVRNLTPENAEIAKAAFQKRPAIVAAIFGSAPATFVDDNYIYDGQSLDSEESPEYEPWIDYAANEYVSASFTDSLPKHFWWDCCLDALVTCAPTPIRALIDSGASPVMISSQMVEIYGLVPKKLHTPFYVSGAFSSDSPSASSTMHALSTYCRLHLQSRDAQWKSRVVKAIIVPNLVTDIILGLDFQIRNRIVFDPELGMAIAKDTGFDLLNPPDPSLAKIPVKLSPPQQHQAVAAKSRAEAEKIRSAQKHWLPARKSVHAELLQLFTKFPIRFDFAPHTTGSPNIIGLVRNRIEQLASLEALSNLDTKFKELFHDCFPSDIPHKSILFTMEIDFLGHHISARGIEADMSKVERIMNWPRPRSAKDVRWFLGLVRYIATFLPALAEHTSILTPLTCKECNTSFPGWSLAHQAAFDAIKQLVLSRECLTTINHEDRQNNQIFVTCNASQRCTGVVLTFGPTWETARPVAFESRQLKGAELHYPVHKQEMLAIMRAVTKWRSDLLGSHIDIYTDHKTLENFNTQRDLSRRQAR
ncbi:Transposon Tf2-11 polyprotein [Hypsizygus marmoreus]|uniref:RNA-directed DNA polymerase n=1 Tax=Hypsizygus marmoreus TaxID=39966 RepID=A0A369JBS1_HYPMA|nr:Transposon Tf2-11 polyprotein [Hypsizygus marmoreus]